MLEIRVPADQSEGTRSQVLRWLKAEGESVIENEPLIEMETDKVTVEIASPGAGVLRQILKQAQDEVEPGEVLGLIEREAGTASATGSAVGTAGSMIRAGAVESIAAARSSTTAQPANSNGTALSPAVRRLLSEHGLDAVVVRGTGAGGRITIDDVLAHVAQSPQPGRESRDTHQPNAQKSGSAAEPGVRRVPHSAVRKRVAEHMVRSLLHTAPHVTSVFEADLSAVLAHRARHREEFEGRGAPLTLTTYFLAATVEAIRAVPEANSRWTDDALEIFDAIHVGVATALGDQGLVVPVLRNVESLDLAQIASQLNALVSRAREGQLTPEDVRGGTFTISNHGVSGSLLATPIVIHQPQSAILGIGKLEKRVIAVSEGDSERFVAVPKCYVTLTIDHRVMDGYQANRFLQAFVGKLERWS